ncbi:MAG: transglycosylase family protein, partial [Mycobacteriaceae bacterium]
MTTHLVRRLLGAGLAFATALTAFTLISTPSAAADPSANDWARVRMCESSNNYAINTGNGYYGAYQFNLA